MKDPIIVFCEKGHIYDASLNEECPYCKKIQQGENRLNSIVGDRPGKLRAADSAEDDGSEETELLIENDDSEETELLVENDDSEETELLIEEDDTEETEMLVENDDSEETEMLIEDDDTEETEMLIEDDDTEETEMLIEDDDTEETEMLIEDDDTEETEMLIEDDTEPDLDIKEAVFSEGEYMLDQIALASSDSNESEDTDDLGLASGAGPSAGQPDLYAPAGSAEALYVQGWLVCIKGREKGTSYTLSAYNSLAFTTEGRGLHKKETTAISHEQSVNVPEGEILNIIRNRNGEFVLRNPGGRSYFVDGLMFTSDKKLYPYAHIIACEREYVFVPFVGTQFNWEE